jgi:hypothetical protein
VVFVGLALGVIVSYVVLEGLPLPSLSAPAPRLPAGDPADVQSHPAEGPGTGGQTSREAVESFLDAEIRKDFPASYRLLSAADRKEFRTAAGWVEAHADLPPVTGYRIENVSDRQGPAEVLTLLDLSSSLDEVVGLVPARARTTWVTVLEEGAWFVSLGDTVIQPIYPPEDQVPGVVREWAEARRACRKAPEYMGGLLGVPSLANALCGARGNITLGTVDRLADELDAAPFLAAFGPEVTSWARVVPLTSPVSLQAVVAPVNDHWLVIGVVRKPLGGDR